MPDFDQVVLRTPICIFLSLYWVKLLCVFVAPANDLIKHLFFFYFFVFLSSTTIRVDLGLHHIFLSLAVLCQYLIPIMLSSFSTSLANSLSGVSSFLSPSILAVTTCCAILSLFLLSLLPRYLHLRNPTVSSTMPLVSNAGITYCKVHIFLLSKIIS